MPMGKKKPTPNSESVSSALDHMDESALARAAALSSESESAAALPTWASATPLPRADTEEPTLGDEMTVDEDLPATPPCEEEDVHQVQESQPVPPEQLAAALEAQVPDEEEDASNVGNGANRLDGADGNERLDGLDGLDDLLPTSQDYEQEPPSAHSDPDWAPSVESEPQAQEDSPMPVAAPPKRAAKPRWAAPKTAAAQVPKPAASTRTPARTKKRSIVASSSSEESTPAPAAPPPADEEVVEGTAVAADELGDEPVPALTPTTTAKSRKDKNTKGKKAKDSGTRTEPEGGKKKGKKSQVSDEQITSKAIGKQKAAKKIKDPNAPKRAMPAYQLWAADARKAEPFSSMEFIESSKALGAAWKAVTAVERAPYETRAKEDKKRYELEMKTYTPPVMTPEEAAAAMPKPKKRATKKAPVIEEDDEDGDAAVWDADDADESMGATTNDEGSGSLTVYRGPCSLVDARRITRTEAKPLYEKIAFEPRATQSMRVDSFKSGDEVVWVPQAFLQFLQTQYATAHAHTLSHEHKRMPITHCHQNILDLANLCVLALCIGLHRDVQ